MVEVNLLPQNMRRRNEPNIWKFAAIGLPITGLLIMGVVTVVYSLQESELNRQVDDANSQIAALQPSKTEFDTLSRRRTELQAVTNTADQLLATKTSWSSDLARFVNQIPTVKDVALTSLTVGTATTAATPVGGATPFDGKAISKTFTLNGRARSTQALVRFLNAYERSPEFGITFNNATRDEQTQDYTFNAVVGLVAPAQPASATTTAAAGTPAAAPAAPATPPATGGSTDVR
ncbi:hypothetical protein [Deinococcus maricopensis]|uniref:Fimbrial assembly family protein n=1 Tax=Deinococcus maricopensis (strain DSM 21211 / LMG 22137 / NRRL B-23946 / LB-34) TaxID=709986 RepID=E8U803_DEIML|nr:hypothetical protein [Deinococcus maricopensis]ADV67192.1 Fimbrial assembly family protein [Deinococcus maricopensis DSM 21211]